MGGVEGASRENLSVFRVPERTPVSLCESFTKNPSHVKAGPRGILGATFPAGLFPQLTVSLASDCKRAY